MSKRVRQTPAKALADVTDHDRRFSPRLKDNHRPISNTMQYSASAGDSVSSRVVERGDADKAAESPALESAPSSPDRKRLCTASLPLSVDVVASADGSSTTAEVQHTPCGSTSLNRRRSLRLMQGSNPGESKSDDTAVIPTVSGIAALGHPTAAFSELDSSAGLLNCNATGAAAHLGAKASLTAHKDADSKYPRGQDLTIEPVHDLLSCDSNDKEQDHLSENQEQAGITQLGHHVVPLDVALADPVSKKVKLVVGSENSRMNDVLYNPADSELGTNEARDVVSTVNISFTDNAERSLVCLGLPREPPEVPQAMEACVGSADTAVLIQTCTGLCGRVDGASQEQQGVQPPSTNAGCLEPASIPSPRLLVDRKIDPTVAAGESACPAGSPASSLSMEQHRSAVTEPMIETDLIGPLVETVRSGALMPIVTASAQEPLAIDSANQQQIKNGIGNGTSADLSGWKSANQEASDITNTSHEPVITVKTVVESLPSDAGFKFHPEDICNAKTMRPISIHSPAKVETAIGEKVRLSSIEPSTLHDTIGNDSSSSDELPAVLEGNDSPVVFRKDMLVWYKYQKDPFWPAVIESSSKAKFTLRFLNYGSSECSKLPVSRKSARKQLCEYPGPKHREFVEAGKQQYKDPKVFELAVRHADDYLQGRALQTITAGPCDYFRALYENPKGSAAWLLDVRSSPASLGIGGRLSDRGRPAAARLGGCGHGARGDAAGAAALEAEAHSEDSSSAESEDQAIATLDQDEPAPAPVFRYSKETEEVIERRKHYGASLVEIVHSDRGHLLELMKNVESGAVDSPFKRDFQPYVKQQPVPLRGPIDDEDQYVELSTYLLEMYKSEVVPGYDVAQAVNAVMYVMLPEVVVHALVQKEGISRAEALSIFQAGIKHTDEELLKPIEIRQNTRHTRSAVEKFSDS